MTKYKVRLQAEASEDPNDVMVEAASIKTSANWVFFHSNATERPNNVVAAFPKERVISVTTVVKN
jgi:uncharacterized protein (DUF1778 family)